MSSKVQLLALALTGTGGVSGITVPLTYKYLGTSASQSVSQQTISPEEQLRQFLKDKDCYTLVKNKAEDQLIVCQSKTKTGDILLYLFSKTEKHSLKDRVRTLNIYSGANESTWTIGLKYRDIDVTSTFSEAERSSNLEDLNGLPISCVCEKFEKGTGLGEQDKTFIVCSKGSIKKEVTKLELLPQVQQPS